MKKGKNFLENKSREMKKGKNFLKKGKWKLKKASLFFPPLPSRYLKANPNAQSPVGSHIGAKIIFDGVVSTRKTNTNPALFLFLSNESPPSLKGTSRHPTKHQARRLAKQRLDHLPATFPHPAE